MIILEGKNMLSKFSLHSELKHKLELPDHYGENLDALWDCLIGWVDMPIVIEWREFSQVERSLGHYAIKVLEQFQEVEGVTISVPSKTLSD